MIEEDPVFILKNAPKPDHGRNLVLRQPDDFALEVTGVLNPFLPLDKDAGVPENPRGKNRYGYEPVVPPGTQHDVGGERGFGDVELLIPELAPKDFLDFEGEIIQTDAFWDDPALHHG